MQSINVCTPGHLDMADSYGLIAGQLARHLTALGCHVNLLALGDNQHPNQPADVAAITGQPMRAALGSISLGYPTGYHRYPAIAQVGPRVALTMFESTRLPAGWAEVLNTMDAVITPSQFCREVFQRCGVTAPMQVHVVPLGVSEVYRPAQRKTDGPFTFLAFMDRGLRKGGLTALQAFLRAFGDDSNYRLILKGRTPKVGMSLTNENVEVIQRDMSELELHELYLSAHCLVNPTKGEGFGLIPREFAATGGISLSTGWGGTADDIAQWGIPIPYRLVKADWRGAKALEGQDLGDWAEVDSMELAALMRYVALERERLLRQAHNQAPQVRRLYDWRRFAERVLDLWKGVADGNISGAKAAA
ncbi:MAG: glycosyltransferase family 4 protein [Caldilineaceae bacterium]|nr:glycosyltransferase family 4 protein [Caldilineaceae bacterium]